MKKIKNLSESSFLKLFFLFVAAAFLIGAVTTSVLMKHVVEAAEKI